MVEHATYKSVVNEALKQCGYAPIPDSVGFTDDAAQEQPQVLARVFCNEQCAMMALEFDDLFNQRSFQLNTVAGTREYPTDELTNIESIMFHSLRCNTAGSPQRVDYLPYEEFRDRYPDADLTTMATGSPQLWTYTPSPIAAGNQRTNKLLLWPIPDAPLVYEYWAKLIYTPLVNATDKIIFPPDYQIALVSGIRAMLERKGKTDDYSDYSEKVKALIKQKATGPVENKIRTRNSARVGWENRSMGNRQTGSKYL